MRCFGSDLRRSSVLDGTVAAALAAQAHPSTGAARKESNSQGTATAANDQQNPPNASSSTAPTAAAAAAAGPNLSKAEVHCVLQATCYC